MYERKVEKYTCKPLLNRSVHPTFAVLTFQNQRHMHFIDLIIYIGTFVFALTGALKARTHKMDIFGATVLAFVTAYGGGTTRDLLIGIRPVNWMNDYIPLGLILLAVSIVFLFDRNVEKFKRTILITDAIGLGMFTIGGIERSLDFGVNHTYALLMGVVTATFGGLIADIISNQVPALLKKEELYATACAIGGILYLGCKYAGIPDEINMAICLLVIISIRIISRMKKVALPHI